VQKINIVDGEQISVWAYPESRLIHHQIHKPCFGEPFRQALLAGVDAMREHRAIAWLSDDRENLPLSPDDASWGRGVWFPKARVAGWELWAMVQPRSALGRMNVAQFVRDFGSQGITVRVFDDPLAALAWIQRSVTAPEPSPRTLRPPASKSG